MKEEIRTKRKHSKVLLEGRKKEQTLVKLKKYDEADEVKKKIDLLEIQEKQRMENELQDQIEKKESKIKNQQQLAISALLKRIQRDRNEQLRQRQADSQRLIQRNKNLLNDLLIKHAGELKKTVECIKQALESIKGGESNAVATPPSTK